MMEIEVEARRIEDDARTSPDVWKMVIKLLNKRMTVSVYYLVTREYDQSNFRRINELAHNVLFGFQKTMLLKQLLLFTKKNRQLRNN